MNPVIAALRRHAAQTPQRIALADEERALSYAEVLGEVEALAERLRKARPRALALLADNGSAWAIADLAAQQTAVPLIPIPLFLSSAQIAHVIRSAGVDRVLTDDPARLAAAWPDASLPGAPLHGALRLASVQTSPVVAWPAGTQKITFTSGTTGEPKGVCLGLDEMTTVAESLAAASAATSDDRHLCLLPLPTLLENIGGLYTPLLAGATTCLPRLAEVGLTGSSALDVGRLIAALAKWQATSAIMVPQMLQAIVAAARNGAALPRTLRYLAVGGAPVSRRLLAEARALGLPVYQGYGLSECASVVAVNRPGDNRDGSVGKPLPHLKILIAEDGEIIVENESVRRRGYLGAAAGRAAAERAEGFATGDIGRFDADGFLYVTGRKKDIFITSFGRNIAPEWIESELTARAPIVQAAVFGEARPFNSAVIVAHPAASAEAVRAALAAANLELPDYARIAQWIPAEAPFAVGNGLATPNGRLRRPEILRKYAAQIKALYRDQNRKGTA